MRAGLMLCAAGALALVLMPPAAAQTGDQPAAAKTTKVKKKTVRVRQAPRPATDPDAGQMMPGTGPALLRGVKDDNM